MKQVFRLFIIAGVLGSLLGCGSSHEDSDATVRPEYASSKLNLDSTQEWGTLKSGTKLNSSRLVVDLAYVPSEAGKASLPSCMELLPNDFKLGMAVCGDRQYSISAANVQQTCSANKSYGTVKASDVTTFKGCKSVSVRAYRFSQNSPKFSVK